MLDTMLPELSTVCIYVNILNDEAVKKVISLLRLLKDEKSVPEDMINAYCGVYTSLLQNNLESFYEHVVRLTFNDENTFTLSCEKHEADVNSFLAKQAETDLKIIEKLATIDCANLIRKMKERSTENSKIHNIVDNLPNWNCNKNTNWEKDILSRSLWHEKNGAGLFSQHVFFTYDGDTKSFIPVKNQDPITLDELYLLDSQKEMTVKNTKIFLSGSAANNILFYGDRGTGKSSMVKALANKFSHCGLRLVEIPKRYLDQIPRITSILSNRGLKFILFIDDLAFENNEEEYTALKAVLEGGIEHRPSNILLYATSNRRHLIKESFADRKGLSSENPDDEVRARDSIQEKLSLSDRFGITIVFTSPAKKEYLQIVHKIAEKENINIDPELLEQKAMQWEMSYNGMSPRTARQFIYWLKGEMELN